MFLQSTDKFCLYFQRASAGDSCISWFSLSLRIFWIIKFFEIQNKLSEILQQGRRNHSWKLCSFTALTKSLPILFFDEIHVFFVIFRQNFHFPHILGWKLHFIHHHFLIILRFSDEISIFPRSFDKNCIFSFSIF